MFRISLILFIVLSSNSILAQGKLVQGRGGKPIKGIFVRLAVAETPDKGGFQYRIDRGTLCRGSSGKLTVCNGKQVRKGVLRFICVKNSSNYIDTMPNAQGLFYAKVSSSDGPFFQCATRGQLLTAYTYYYASRFGVPEPILAVSGDAEKRISKGTPLSNLFNYTIPHQLQMDTQAYYAKQFREKMEEAQKKDQERARRAREAMLKRRRMMQQKKKDALKKDKSEKKQPQRNKEKKIAK